MSNTLYEAYYKLYEMVMYTAYEGGIVSAVLRFIPFVLFFELPFMLLVMLGVVRYWLRTQFGPAEVAEPYYPSVTCIVTCYAEGDAARAGLYALAHQRYPGKIEILAIVDGAARNSATWRAARSMQAVVAALPNRTLIAVPKWQRGGRVSSTNAGLALARGEIVVSLDADTVLDNDAVYRLTRHFADSNVAGVACNLRVLNDTQNPLTALQALEYMMSIKAMRTGLSEVGAVNNVSGAFGAFRRSFVRHIGGWDTGPAEDLDLCTRIKAYSGRYPQAKLRFEPRAVGHTEAPATVKAFLEQRLRWDGDLCYIYNQKHWRSFTPRLLGWRGLLLQCWTGLFFQIVMPVVILAYMLYLCIAYPPSAVLGVMSLVYLFYLAMAIALFLQYLLMLSERPQRDLLFAPLLLIYPVYAFFGRCWNAFSSLMELVVRSHRDTMMAPWWVLRRNDS